MGIKNKLCKCIFQQIFDHTKIWRLLRLHSYFFIPTLRYIKNLSCFLISYRGGFPFSACSFFPLTVYETNVVKACIHHNTIIGFIYDFPEIVDIVFDSG